MSFSEQRPQGKTSRSKWLQTVTIVVVVAVIGVLFYLFKQWLGEQTISPGKKKVQQITVIAPPPPPPPPPPPQVEQTPPEVEEVEVEEPEPTPEALPDEAPSEAPPGEQLGLDADGTGAGDAFGLVGKKGGRGLLSGGDPYVWYSNALQQKLFDTLNENHDIRRSSYSIVVYLWIDKNGELNELRLAKGSNDPALDKKIKAALFEIKRLEPPVAGMPQPVKIKLTARL